MTAMRFFSLEHTVKTTYYNEAYLALVLFSGWRQDDGQEMVASSLFVSFSIHVDWMGLDEF
jgi:hypothetical protein